MNILITSAGQRVSLVKAFQNEIKKFDKNAKIYTVDSNPILAPACHVSDGFDPIVKVTSEDYINKLLEICINRKINLIIPTIDTELLILSQNKDLFMQNGIIPIVSNLEFIQTCRDKRISNQFFVDNGIDIPQKIDKCAPIFPLFIKPYDGSLSKDIFVINEKSELTAYHLTNTKLMFMEYIDPSQNDEYTVDTYYDKDGVLKCVVPRKRIFVRSGEVNKAVTHKNEIISFVKDRLNTIQGAVGCLTMQFFFNSNTKRIVGIEINPRFGGGYPLSYLAGANFPKWLIDEYFFNMEIPFFQDWENNLLMLRYDDEVLIRNYE